MQLELTLRQSGGDFASSDLGFLLHKHPAHLHERELSYGKGYVFFPEAGDEETRAVLYLDIDPVGLVRGRGQGQALLAQYVNDRPYAVNSFLSVAIAKVFGQSLSGKSKEKQDLADQALSYFARIVPVAITGGEEVARSLFEPLGYQVEISSTGAGSEFAPGREYYDLRLSGEFKLSELLNHLYVLIPVLDNEKHYYVDKDEVENLLLKGEGWLEGHPEKELIAKRALKYRRSLANVALARLSEIEGQDSAEGDEEKVVKASQEEQLEKPIRLHDIRLDTVAERLAEEGVRSVLDLGCGEGKLLKRLIKERGFKRIVGVDADIASLERASDKLYLKNAGESVRERVQLMQGSLTYADRRLKGFDAATLVEVIEHIDLPRLSAIETSLFGVAKPGLVIVTTPNREYNALFENMPEGRLRHPDHRFEWTRPEFQNWGARVAKEFGYVVEFSPLGPEDEKYGAPSQMGIFRKE